MQNGRRCQRLSGDQRLDLAAGVREILAVAHPERFAAAFLGVGLKRRIVDGIRIVPRCRGFVWPKTDRVDSDAQRCAPISQPLRGSMVPALFDPSDNRMITLDGAFDSDSRFTARPSPSPMAVRTTDEADLRMVEDARDPVGIETQWRCGKGTFREDHQPRPDRRHGVGSALFRPS